MNKLVNDVVEYANSYYDDLVGFLPRLVLALIVFIMMYFLAVRLKKFTKDRLARRMDDPLLAVFLSRIVKAGIMIIALLFVLRILRMSDIAGGLLAGAGVGAFVIGFAFKDIGENFLAGILLAFKRPFRIGDTVELNGITGSVVTLNMRDTHIKSFDGKDIYIPNANVVKNPVVNFTMDGYLRHDQKVRLAYGSDVSKAISLTLGVLQEIDGILQENKPPAVHASLADAGSIQLTAYYWFNTLDPDISGLQLKTNASQRIVTALTEAGFHLLGDVVEIQDHRK